MQQKIKKNISFLKTAFQDRDVAAVASSSSYVVKRVIEQVRSTPAVVLEYGAGSGVMTKALLSLLPADGLLVAIESNTLFSDELKKINDPRLRVFTGTVQQFYEEETFQSGQVDLIVSSIPFSFLSPQERDDVVKESRRVLSKQGSFIVFHQYTTLMKKYLKKEFPLVSIDFEIRNIFPCFILGARFQ